MLEQKSIVIVVIMFMILAVTMLNNNKIVVTVKDCNSIQKKTYLNYVFLVFLFWILAVCIRDSADLSVYRWAYEDGISHGKEPLFDTIQHFFRTIGWSFDSFKLLWVSIIAILIYTGVKKYSDVPGKVMALALVTIMAGFVTQMRSALVGAIFLNAFSLLSGKKRDKIAYCLIIVLATQVHIAGYCFLLFAIINKKGFRIFQKHYYIAIAIITIMVLLSSTVFLSYINNVFSNFSSVSVSRALSSFSGETLNFKGKFFLLCKHLFLFYLTNTACNIQINETEKSTDFKQYVNIVREANILMLTFLPITMVSPSFERIFNIFALIQYGIILNEGKHYISLPGRISWKQSMQSILIMGLLFFTFIEWHSNPHDLIKVLNSIEWSF